MHNVHKFINAIKIGVICSVLSFIIISSMLSSPSYGQQELNLKSSIVISVGLGASLRMARLEKNKMNNYT